jgi:signal transduction histidine kinase/DNA-binding response OmpR family regulator
LGDGTAFDLFDEAKDVPIIMLTGSGDEELAVKAMKAGAADYLIKDPERNHLKTLLVTVENAIRRQQAEEELQRYREHLEDLVAERTAELTHANEQLLSEIAERKRAEEALQRYAERLRTLRAIDGAILAAWSAEEIAQSALRHIQQLIPSRRASLATFDMATREATVLVTLVDGESTLGTGARLPMEMFGGWQALQQGKIHVVEDIHALSQSTPTERVLQAEGVRCYINVPLIARGELVGSLNLGTGSPGAFTTEHIDIAQEVANEIAVALHQARLYEQIEQHVTELEYRVAERTAELSAANVELAQAARLKDEFLASMSHELRTPLNAVLGLSEALQEGIYGPINERQRKSMRSIEASGRHLLSLINDILDVAKIEAGKVELSVGPVSVESVCRAGLGLVKQSAHKKRLKVSSSFDSTVGIIQADERRLKQVLVNLLSNAVKFTPESGTIGLEVEGDAQAHVVHVTVWDTGIGISSEGIERLFQPFVQLDSSLSRQYDGTGLGLVLVKRITEMHGGSISVESQPGQGSRFTVSFPRDGPALSHAEGPVLNQAQLRKEQQPSQEAPSSASDQPATHADSPLILLAEDNEENVHTISDYLLARGYRVTVARDGRSAIERARQEHPDVILLDVQMPEMDGLEATRRIRADAQLDNVPIIALTALAMPSDRERCLQAGADDYLSKPVSLKELVEAIESQLRKANGGLPPSSAA